MNAQDLLDASIGQLDREVGDDPATAEALSRLTRHLNLLLDDGLDDLEPPPDLARRTLARVAERRRRPSILEFAPVRVPFRWADVAVAAGIFLAGVLTLMPAVRKGRARMDQAGCTVNLQQLGLALNQYASSHGRYPYVAAGHPASRAGSYAVLLHDANLLPGAASLDCPGNGVDEPPTPLPHFEALCQSEARSPRSSPCLCHDDYAYNITPPHVASRHGAIPASLHSALPLLADKPAHDGQGAILPGNSPNHGGSGQNVLFSDGHVSWHPSRKLGPHDADMFLNASLSPAPGSSILDAVLVPGTFRFDGGP